MPETPTPSAASLFGLGPAATLVCPAGEAHREPVRVARLTPDLVWKLDKLVRVLDELGILLDDVCCGLGVFPGESRVPPRKSAGRRSASASGDKPIWITSLVTKGRADGWLQVTLGVVREGKLVKRSFHLQPALGVLFLILAHDRGSTPDEGIGFKPLRDIALEMRDKLGGGLLPNSTISKYLHKVRAALRRAGLPASIVQTNRRLGGRLAIRQKQAADQADPLRDG